MTEEEDDARLEAEVRAQLALGLEPCVGVECDRWLDPRDGEVVLRAPTGDPYCGDCAMLRDDFDSVSGVAQSLFARGVVLGRRFSLGPCLTAVRQEGDPDWSVVSRNGSTIYLTHDAFEAARWFCKLESGDFGYDPSAPPMVHPPDHVLAALQFGDNYGYLLTPPRRTP